MTIGITENHLRWYNLSKKLWEPFQRRTKY